LIKPAAKTFSEGLKRAFVQPIKELFRQSGRQLGKTLASEFGYNALQEVAKFIFTNSYKNAVRTLKD